jgi:hypothetical protein
MKRTGPKFGLVFVMVIYIIFVAVCHQLCLYSENFWWEVNYLLGAVFVATANLAVAVQNYTGRNNLITRFLIKITGSFYK